MKKAEINSALHECKKNKNYINMVFYLNRLPLFPLSLFSPGFF